MASTPRQTSTARTLSGPNPVVKPTLVFVGSQKGGVGKTTIARLILHWLEEIDAATSPSTPKCRSAR